MTTQIARPWRFALAIAFALAGFAHADSSATPPADTAAPRDDARPTLYLVGDSTVRNGTPGQVGWGDRLAQHFDASRIRVINRARGGRSSRSYYHEGLWDALLAEMRPGDYVLIQFGHNDGGKPHDSKGRGSVRGIGEETVEVTDPATGESQVVHTFGWYLRKYVADAKAKGVTPILVSYIPRAPRPGAAWPPSDATPTTYALWTRQVAEAQGVPFIDLHGLLLSHYLTLTPDEIKSRYFCEQDWTHTSDAGAKHNAQTVANAIRELKDCNLASYLAATAE